MLSTISRYLIYSLLIFTPLARGSVQQWAIAAIHLITLTALTLFLMEKSLKWDWKWIKTPLDLPILCLLLLCLLSTVFSLVKMASIWSFILLLNYLTILYLTIHLTRTRAQLKTLIYLITGIASFLAIFGLFKRFGMNPFPWWNYGDLKYSPDFLSATYGSHNHLAGYLEMTLPLVFGFFLMGFRRGKLFIISYISILILTALILSLSRGGWIGTLISLSFMAMALVTGRYYQKKRLLISVIGGLLSLSLIIMASTPVVERVRTVLEKDEAATLESRVMVWGGVIEMIRDYPLTGSGPGTFSTIFTQYQPAGIGVRFMMAHNDYLHFISEVGLPLILVILWMVLAIYHKGFEKLKNPSRLIRGATLGAMTGITAILVHSIVDFNLHIPANAILFTVLTAIVVSPIHNKR